MSIRKFVEKYDIGPWKTRKSIQRTVNTIWNFKSPYKTTTISEVLDDHGVVSMIEKFPFGLKSIHINRTRDSVDRSSQSYDIVSFITKKSIKELPKTKYLALRGTGNSIQKIGLLPPGLLSLIISSCEVDLKNQTDLIYLGLHGAKVKNVPCSVTTLKLNAFKASSGIRFSKLPLLNILIMDGKIPVTVNRKNLPNLKVFVYNEHEGDVPKWMKDEDKAGTLTLFTYYGRTV